MDEATAPLRVASEVVRMRPGQLFWWKDHILWRRGPDTPNGFWMIYALGLVRAVRVIYDDGAPERTALEFMDALGDATGRERPETRAETEDNYLTALTGAAEIPVEELVRLRDAVRAGRAGGPIDGRRTRKGAAS